MAKANELARILDRCLDRIQAGEATLAECLRAYPEQASGLEPLLRAALDTTGFMAPSPPGEEYRQTSEARLLNLLRASQRKGDIPRRRRAIRAWRRLRPAYALAGLLLAIGVIAGSFRVANAAGDALPGDMLYSVKRGLEEAQLILSLSSEGDSRLLLAFADRRLAEAETLLAAGRQMNLEAAMEGYEGLLGRLIELSARQGSSGNGDLGRVDAALGRHQELLQDVLSRAPVQAQEAVADALERSQHGRNVLQQVRQGISPGEIAPGQIKKTPATDSGQSGDSSPSRTPRPTKTPRLTKKPRPTKTERTP